MTAPRPPRRRRGLAPLPPPCRRCAGLGGIHYLTCPSLRLPRPGRGRWQDPGERTAALLTREPR